MGPSPLQQQVTDYTLLGLEELGEPGTLEHLEKASSFTLSGVLEHGGSLLFPHIFPRDCGYQVAACVQACLDCGTDTILVLGVLHAVTEPMEEARTRVNAGGDPSQEEFWGVQGPGLNGRNEWRWDHSLIGWRHFWEAELARRGQAADSAPRVVERYPFLCGGEPARLPGIDELCDLASHAAVVATGDLFHHGIGYGTPAAEAFPPDEAGIRRAREAIDEGMSILAGGDYRAYAQHAQENKSDARDVGQVLRLIRGPIKGRILDVSVSDAAMFYEAADPTWVAGALCEWQPIDAKASSSSDS